MPSQEIISQLYTLERIMLELVVYAIMSSFGKHSYYFIVINIFSLSVLYLSPQSTCWPEFKILLCRPPDTWDYRYESQCPTTFGNYNMLLNSQIKQKILTRKTLHTMIYMIKVSKLIVREMIVFHIIKLYFLLHFTYLFFVGV